MSTVAMPSTTETSQVDRVRETMSFANILTHPPAPDPDDTTNAPRLSRPSTPTKARTPTEETNVTSPDAGTPDESVKLGEIDGADLSDSERDFICMNDESSRCVTGQYTKDLSRKVISDHFGRNKACTRDITDWPLFCRKHYQRATYNKRSWQVRKLNLIHRQFDKIEEQFPGTTYDIQWKKSEEARLNEYSRKIAAGWSEQDAAQTVVPVPGKYFEAPIKILRELDLDIGKHKTLHDVKDVVETILDRVTDGTTDQVPSIEFLPNLPGRLMSPDKSIKTPSPKKSRTSTTPKSQTTPRRISNKGSIQKTRQET